LQTIYTVQAKPDLQPLYGYLVGPGEPDERAPSSFSPQRFNESRGQSLIIRRRGFFGCKKRQGVWGARL
jgi:hypothetical protein